MTAVIIALAVIAVFGAFGWWIGARPQQAPGRHRHDAATSRPTGADAITATTAAGDAAQARLAAAIRRETGQ